MIQNRDILVKQAGSALHVTITGEFNGSRAGTLLNAVAPHLRGPSRSIVLDLSATDYIDSSGLWEIATVRTRAGRAGKSLSMQVRQGSRMAYIIRSTSFQPTIPVDQIALATESEAPSA